MGLLKPTGLIKMRGNIYIVLVFALLKCTTSIQISEDTQRLLIKMVENGPPSKPDEDCNVSDSQKHHELIGMQNERIRPTGVKFECPVSSVDLQPSSVHALRPEDIDVVAAVGDSYTAAFGAGASFLGPSAFLEHRGLSFSIGGDGTLESHVSIPNILKKYNPDVYGFSVGVGTRDRLDTSHLNVAVTGATSEDLPDQVDFLIKRLQHDPRIDMTEDWKLINVLIGGNDVFDACLQPRFTPEHFREYLRNSFNKLKEQVPRALVNIMALPDIVEVTKLTGPVCKVAHMSMCPCLFGGDAILEKIKLLSQEFNNILTEMATSDEFDTDDFAMIYQPSIGTSYVPVNQDGQADSSIFAPDCIHISRRGHATAAFYLWSNMFEPVHAKFTKWAPTIDEYLPCPSSQHIYTNRNSVSNNFGISSNQELSMSDATTGTGGSSMGGGAIAAIVFLVGAVVIISGYIVHKRYLRKSRWSYESL